MAIADVYVREFHRQTRFYYSHWMPNSPLKLGDVGILEDGCYFRPRTTFADLGIPFDPSHDVVKDTKPSPLELVSNNGVSVSVKLAGQVNPDIKYIPEAKAGLQLTFGAEGAFIIRAAESYEPRIRNIDALQKEVLKAYRRGAWKREYVAIFSIVEAPYADIIISESSEASIELQVSADGHIGNIQLGSAELGFTVVKQSGSLVKLMSCRDVTPAFQLVGLKRKLFGGAFLEIKKGASFATWGEQGLTEGADEDLCLEPIVAPEERPEQQ